MSEPSDPAKADNSCVAPQSLPAPEFAVEEYKQVLEEGRMIMTRYIQAIGLYLALSGFGLKELVATRSHSLVLAASIVFTMLNVLAIYAARSFRRMAAFAAQREKFFVEQYRVEPTHECCGDLWQAFGSLSSTKSQSCA